MNPLHERVRELREARGLSQPELYREVEGVGLDTIRGVETPPGKKRHRYPSPRVLAAIADGLDVEPDAFPEYRLAQARRLLDERVVGVEAALAYLEAISAAGLPVKPGPGVEHELDVQEATRPSGQQTDGSASSDLAQDREAQ